LSLLYQLIDERESMGASIQMPPIASQLIDTTDVAAVEAWIAAMPPAVLPMDAGSDASRDSGRDAAPDAARDAMPDATRDAVADAEREAGYHKDASPNDAGVGDAATNDAQATDASLNEDAKDAAD
jgi:hypothetical protein